MFLTSLFLSLPFSLEAMKKMSTGEDKINKYISVQLHKMDKIDNISILQLKLLGLRETKYLAHSHTD